MSTKIDFDLNKTCQKYQNHVKKTSDQQGVISNNQIKQNKDNIR